MTTIGIVQSCYIPWKGYFDLIRQCDLFVLYDCVQYTTRDWRNRNLIKTPGKPAWLTIPLQYAPREQLICERRAADDAWKELHWKSIRHAYTSAPHFSEYAPGIQALYQSCEQTGLSDINLHFLRGINEILGITTPLILLKQHAIPDGDKTDKLVAVCRQYNATRYLSGPKANTYLDVKKFTAIGMEVAWMDYTRYPEYPQLYPPFTHAVTMLDLIFNAGKNWENYMLTP